MFTIELQVNNSEKNKFNKDINTISTYNGTLKNPTSVIDPIIQIACDLEDVVSANYLTIDSFNRSYFIKEIKSVRNGLVEFSCHVDVLSSFSEQILSNRAIIKRQENNWNLYLNDGSFKVYQNPNVVTKPFPSGFTTQEFVLAVAGD